MRIADLWELLARFPVWKKIDVAFDGLTLEIAEVDDSDPGEVTIFVAHDDYVAVPRELEDEHVNEALAIEFRSIPMPEITDAMISAAVDATLIPPDKLRVAFEVMWSQAHRETNTTPRGIREIWRVLLEAIDNADD